MGRGRGRSKGGGRGRGRGAKRGPSGGEGGSEQPDKRQRTAADDYRTDPWKKPEDIQSNGLFEGYYKEQGVCPPEEWDAFIRCLKTPLPITFRINGQGRFAERLQEQMERNFMAQFTEGPLMIEGEEIEKPHPLDWYPGKLAWQMNFSRTQLRKLPVLGELHEFIKRENEIGSITRQEAVSMVPPLFLDVEPHHRVLDMCAAPGSKTFQLLEMLHAGPAPTTGLVVANDSDAMRCNLLTHQTKRMCSPAIIVTNHEAQNFPVLRNLLPTADGEVPESRYMFDRILCDVPCSGDGTMRKALDIWRRWNIGSGNGLHSLQLRIALRACELLRVGGRLVYSTCTFNPIENEAVVAEVLRRTKGAFELVDGSDHLEALRRVPGMQRWRVRDRERWYEGWEEGKEGFKLDPTMFPDNASDAMPLHLCMRFLPHHQNTGGFFVAVLRKVRNLDGPLEQVKLDHRATQGKERKAAKAAGEGEGEGAAGTAAAGKGAAVKEEEAAAEGAAAEGAAAAVKEEEMEAAPAEAVAAVKEEAAEGAAAKKEEEAGGPEPMLADGAEAAAAGAAGEAAAAAGGEEAQQEGGKQQEGEVRFSWKAFKQQQKDAAEAELPPPPAGLPEWGSIRGGGGRNREATGATAGSGGFRFRGLDPIVPFVDVEALESLNLFYGLHPGCPLTDALIARSLEARPKKLNYVSLAVKQLLQLDYLEKLKVIGAGVKVLERQDSKDGLVPCCYRLAQDGLSPIMPYVTKQRFEPTVDELLQILQHRLVGMPEGHKIHMTAKPAQAGSPAATEAAAAGGSKDSVPAEGQGQPAAANEAAAPSTAAAGAAAEQGQQAPGEQPAAASGAEQQEQAAEQQGGGEGDPPPAQQAQEQAAQQQRAQQAHQAAQHTQQKPVAYLSDPTTLEQLQSVGMGCCVALMRREDAVTLGFAGEGDEGDGERFAISCWRGRGNLNVLVSKEEASQMAEQIREARARLALAGVLPADVAPTVVGAAAAAAEPVAA